MSAIRTYLQEKAQDSHEWLRREPRETHPEILALVREALEVLAPSAGGTIYDDDVERYANERAGDLPPHSRHGTEGRDPLVVQLGHEVYIARNIVRDDEARDAEAALLEEGFRPLADVEVRDGDRLTAIFGTVYSGYFVPQYGHRHAVTARMFGDRLALLPKGARSRGFDPARAGACLVKGGWS
jgi:hypothetical protein